MKIKLEKLVRISFCVFAVIGCHNNKVNINSQGNSPKDVDSIPRDDNTARNKKLVDIFDKIAKNRYKDFFNLCKEKMNESQSKDESESLSESENDEVTEKQKKKNTTSLFIGVFLENKLLSEKKKVFNKMKMIKQEKQKNDKLSKLDRVLVDKLNTQKQESFNSIKIHKKEKEENEKAYEKKTDEEKLPFEKFMELITISPNEISIEKENNDQIKVTLPKSELEDGKSIAEHFEIKDVNSLAKTFADKKLKTMTGGRESVDKYNVNGKDVVLKTQNFDAIFYMNQMLNAKYNRKIIFEKKHNMRDHSFLKNLEICSRMNYIYSFKDFNSHSGCWKVPVFEKSKVMFMSDFISSSYNNDDKKTREEILKNIGCTVPVRENIVNGYPIDGDLNDVGLSYNESNENFSDTIKNSTCDQKKYIENYIKVGDLVYPEGSHIEKYNSKLREIYYKKEQ